MTHLVPCLVRRGGHILGKGDEGCQWGSRVEGEGKDLRGKAMGPGDGLWELLEMSDS